MVDGCVASGCEQSERSKNVGFIRRVADCFVFSAGLLIRREATSEIDGAHAAWSSSDRSPRATIAASLQEPTWPVSTPETAGPLYPDLETVGLSVRCRKRMRVAQDHGQSLLSADQRVGCGATATNHFALQS